MLFDPPHVSTFVCLVLCLFKNNKELLPVISFYRQSNDYSGDVQSGCNSIVVFNGLHNLRSLHTFEEGRFLKGDIVVK